MRYSSAVAAAGCLVASLTPLAAELKPSWQCLPPETVVAIRVPDGKALFDALHERTRLGKTLFSQKRIDGFKALLKESDPEEWEKFQGQLERFELETEDLPMVFAGESGFAFVLEERKGPEKSPPLGIGLLWLSPGAERLEKIVKSMETLYDEAEDGPEKGVRVDFEVEGSRVTHYAVPTLGMPYIPFELPEGDNVTQEQFQEAVRKYQERQKNAKLQQVDQQNVFVTALEDRLLVGMTFPRGADAAQDGEDAKDIDFAKTSGVEQATAVFARFLAAHKGDDGPFAARVMAAPGVRDALPRGIPVLEVAGDLRPLLSLAARGEPEAGKMFPALGLDRLGEFAVGATLDGTTLRANLFLSAPAPRAGVLELLDASPAETTDAPAWAPATAHGLQTLQLDFAALYRKVQEIARQAVGEAADGTFQTIEAQVQLMAQAELAALLEGLGKELHYVAFPPVKNPEHRAPGSSPAPAASPGGDEDGDDISSEDEVPLAQRAAIVWRLRNAEPWTNLFQAVGMMAAQTGGMLEKTEEQGFSGFRIAAASAGWFLGKGYMVLSFGPEVTEQVLAALRSPPEGEAALKNTAAYRRSRELLPPKKSMLTQYADMSRLMKPLLELIMDGLDESLPEAGGGPEIGELARKLLPSEKEFEGLIGISAAQLFTSPHGIVLESALELPGKSE